jgi:hypothetical protein
MCAAYATIPLSYINEKNMNKKFIVPCFALFACVPASEAPKGIAPTPQGSGPKIIFDLAAKPLPEIPLPNDLATRPDPSSPTGKRLNVSQFAPTNLEAETREAIDQLSGFGTFGAITVSFDALLDLPNIKARHVQDPIDFSDDVLYVVNLNPKSPHCGQPVPLEIGQGNFPINLENSNNYFANDYHAESDNLLFEDTEEDLNQNGTLDPGEDLDFDGVLDHPNTITEGGDPLNDIANFYERETNTLIARPLVPMEEESEYAVILTSRLTDPSGQPIKSPFAFINHTDQTKSLQALYQNSFCPSLPSNIVSELGLSSSEGSAGDIAFAWSFTTQSITRDLVSIREGLYGIGKFASLHDAFPTSDLELFPLIDQGLPGENIHIVSIERLVPLLEEAGGQLGFDAESLGPLIDSLKFVDYIVVGTYGSPSFMAEQNGDRVGYLDEDGNPRELTNDEIVRFHFDLNYQTGEARVGKDRGTFFMAIPKRRPEDTGAFPMTFYGHGYTSSRFEILGFAGNLARQGIATVGLDAVGHGIAIDPALDAAALVLFQGEGVGNTWTAISTGRDRDLNNDGVGDSGADFFTGYLFHLRDNIRQTIVDYMQFIRIMRSFDGTARLDVDLDGDGQNELAGDFNADGVIDIGGPNGRYFAYGQSLGGIVSMILAGADPAITAAAPVSGGAGLVEIGLRSTQGGAKEAVILRAMGPLVIDAANEEGGVDLAFQVLDLNKDPIVHIATFSQTPVPGDTIEVQNLRSEKTFTAGVNNSGHFRISLECDKGDPLIIRLLDATGKEEQKFSFFERDIDFQFDSFSAGSPLVSLGDGFGLPRNSPGFRRFLGLAQLIVDPGDPVNYAPHALLDPLYVTIDGKEVGAFHAQELFPGQTGVPHFTKLLVMHTIGDTAVPISTGMTYARAAGLLSFDEADPLYDALDNDDVPGVSHNGVLLQCGTIEGIERFRRFSGEPFLDNREILFDVDNLDGFDIDGDGIEDDTDCFREYCIDASCSNTGSSDAEVAQICQGPSNTFRRAPQLTQLGLPALRITKVLSAAQGGGVSGVRLPYLEPTGVHGTDVPSPNRAFDLNTYVIQLIGHFFATDGGSLEHLQCLEDNSCSFIRQP